jgi:hypothetical protein
VSETNQGGVDLIRWTLTVPADKKTAVEQHLTEYGLEVFSRGDGHLVVLWDDPEGDYEALVKELWDVVGDTVDIHHEEFRRGELIILHHDPSADQDAA